MTERRSTGMPGVDAQHDSLGEADMRIAAERYRLLRTHAWSDEVLRKVVERRRQRRPRSGDRKGLR